MKPNPEILKPTDDHTLNVVSNSKDSASLIKDELKHKNSKIEQLQLQLANAQAVINDFQQTKQNLFENIYAIENLEREKIAYTLHEGIGQNLASIRFMLKATIEQLKAKKVNPHNLSEIHEILGTTIIDVRNITYKIIPADITKFGFINSLESMIEDLNNSLTSTKFSFYSNIKEDILSINDQLSIYRIIQEGINNIIKHSHAKNAIIQITYSNNTILVTIEDNGVGFNYHDCVRKQTSRGLKNIVERSKALNADIFVESKENLGTCLNVLLNI